MNRGTPAEAQNDCEVKKVFDNVLESLARSVRQYKHLNDRIDEVVFGSERVNVDPNIPNPNVPAVIRSLTNEIDDNNKRLEEALEILDHHFGDIKLNRAE